MLRLARRTRLARVNGPAGTSGTSRTGGTGGAARRTFRSGATRTDARRATPVCGRGPFCYHGTYGGRFGRRPVRPAAGVASRPRAPDAVGAVRAIGAIGARHPPPPSRKPQGSHVRISSPRFLHLGRTAPGGAAPRAPQPAHRLRVGGIRARAGGPPRGLRPGALVHAGRDAARTFAPDHRGAVGHGGGRIRSPRHDLAGSADAGALRARGCALRARHPHARRGHGRGRRARGRGRGALRRRLAPGTSLHASGARGGAAAHPLRALARDKPRRPPVARHGGKHRARHLPLPPLGRTDERQPRLCRNLWLPLHGRAVRGHPGGPGP